jgi:crotonobetainyl-CoA:carnitine CoA-transferase CaiB-like acyl-CoA transferase
VIAGLYPAGDGRWVRLHTNFPHHHTGTLALLGCDGTRVSVGRALLGWQALAFEDAAAAAGLPVTAARSFAEWDAHPQGHAVPMLDLVRVERIGDAPPEPLPRSDRPLGRVRVLELTRVIAGPVGGRTLAAHGADVMNVTRPGLPSYRIEDLGRGKLAAQVDLRMADGRAVLAGLLAAADVFVQGYRPGAIAGHGFSPEAATALRPGLVTASLSAYGDCGPWSGRRGFDSLVQTASGFNLAEAAAAGEIKPKPLPAQALDHATGYLLAAGIMTALYRRATVGGSWHVSVSLARTGHWLRGLGRVADGFSVADPSLVDIADLMETTPSGFGLMTAVRHSAVLDETPARWTRPSMPLGSHPAIWPERAA